MQKYEVLITPDLKELTKHGDSSFPLAIYTTVLSKNKLGYIQRHWHDEIQFVYVTSGRVKFEVEQYVYYVNEGDGIFINQGYLHSATTHGSDDSCYICIDVDKSLYSTKSDTIISNEYLRPFLEISRIKAISLSKEVAWQNEILNIFLELSDIYEKKEFAHEILMQAKIMKILYLMISKSNEFINQDLFLHNDDYRIKEVVQYIQSNYASKISLDDLASRVNLCKSEFCRYFKKMTNQTPFDYLISYRISESAHLLRNSDLSILEISNMVGFNSVSYFVKKFKEKTNCTPKYYRNFYVEEVSK